MNLLHLNIILSGLTGTGPVTQARHVQPHATLGSKYIMASSV